MIPKELTRNVAAFTSGHFQGYLNTNIDHDILQILSTIINVD